MVSLIDMDSTKLKINSFPQRIICLTEESVELLYHLKKDHLIVGVSHYAKRPSQVVEEKEKISTFVSANFQRILDLRPDLVIGFSDIQKDVAKILIDKGLNVLITNQRSIQDILNYFILIGSLVGAKELSEEYAAHFLQKLTEIKQKASCLKRRPKVYFEEWDNPRITAIRWVSELIELAGGENIFAKESFGSKGSDREISDHLVRELNPEIIFACWCGKKVQFNSFEERIELKSTEAMISKKIFELDPEIFLQPGPAILEAANILHEYFVKWNQFKLY